MSFLQGQQLPYLECFLSAVFKKDTKEKNQKKAEAKKRKAEQQEQQEQQEPVDDKLAVTNTHSEPTAATHLPGEAQLPTEQPAQPCLEQPPAHAQLPPAAFQHGSVPQLDNGFLNDSITERGDATANTPAS